MLKPQFKSRAIAVHLHTSETLVCYGFVNEFKQVLLNILNNAKDAITQNPKKQGKVDIFFEKSEDEAVVRVQDNAGGIAEELLPDRLFEPYITTKEHNGTGIGLQISKKIIEENMHGTIYAQNAGDGAEFVMRLPLAGEAR